jgi:hypothetical protein
MYDVSEHPLLSADAVALNDDLFREHQEWAIDQLVVADTSYTGRSRLRIERAIAIQINWQLRLPKNIWFTKQESSSQSRQNVTYRDSISLIDPAAAAEVASVEQIEKVDSRYDDIRSIR